MTDQRPRIQQLPINPLNTLHPTIVPAAGSHARQRHADYSAAS